jgi:hypothetical protein
MLFVKKQCAAAQMPGCATAEVLARTFAAPGLLTWRALRSITGNSAPDYPAQAMTGTFKTGITIVLTFFC